jgi:hypothetical protein
MDGEGELAVGKSTTPTTPSWNRQLPPRLAHIPCHISLERPNYMKNSHPPNIHEEVKKETYGLIHGTQRNRGIPAGSRSSLPSQRLAITTHHNRDGVFITTPLTDSAGHGGRSPLLDK